MRWEFAYWIVVVAFAAADASANAARWETAPDSEYAQMGLPEGDWRTAYGKDNAGRFIRATVRPPKTRGEPIRLAIDVIAPSGARLRKEVVIGGAERASLEDLVKAEERVVEVIPNRFRKRDFFEVSVFARHGEDFMQFIASFFGIGGGGIELLWSGRGDRDERRSEHCQLDEDVNFSLTRAGLLERSVKGARHVYDADLSAERAAEIRAQCTEPPSKHERFPLRQSRRRSRTRAHPVFASSL